MFAVWDAKWFRKESEHCLAQADETICVSSRAQWLLLPMSGWAMRRSLRHQPRSVLAIA